MSMTASAAPAVELRELTKRFGDTVANAGVHLRAQPGTIHGLIGENGAGKSTAMKLLYGMYRPDAGEIFVEGTQRRWNSPADAIAAGIGMVHQHFMLAGPVSALDNILLGAEPRRWGMFRRREARAQLDALGRQYGLPVDWDCPVEQLPVGLQQRVEILKLLYRDARILILDEPTAVLTPPETVELMANLQKLRAQGKTVLLVTHKLNEVMRFTDRVTVFRGGKTVCEMETSRTNPQELANLMVGRKVALGVEAPPAKPRAETAVRVEDLSLANPAASGRHRLSQVSFSLQCGEIVGIAGVEGNGQTELLQALLHPRDPRCRTSGKVEILGRDVTQWKSSQIRALGIALVPEDRQREGLLLERRARENFLLGLQRSPAFSRAGFLRSREVDATAARAMGEFDVRPNDPSIPAGRLSGGNQQKLIFAREFERQPRVVVAAQPTRGVDVGAIEFIHGRIIQARDGGAGVLLVSFELEEILALSDRILVMYEGRIAGEFARGRVTERELGLKMGGS